MIHDVNEKEEVVSAHCTSSSSAALSRACRSIARYTVSLGNMNLFTSGYKHVCFAGASLRTFAGGSVVYAEGSVNRSSTSI